MVKVNLVLDKKFYIVVSFSYLEKGISAAASTIRNKPGADFAENAKAGLHTKAQTIQSQLQSLNLKTKILSQDELTHLFYEVYNGDAIQTQAGQNISPTVISKAVNNI